MSVLLIPVSCLSSTTGAFCPIFGVIPQKFNIQTNTRVLQLASIGYDASIGEIFIALANGGTLCLAGEKLFGNPDALLKFLVAQKIKVAFLPPALLAEMADHPSDSFPDLEILIAGGEKVSAELVKRWAPGRQFFNVYGPTETTNVASMALCDPDDPRDPSIGRPINNARFYILDDHMQPVPVGIPGELYISGVLVGRGYLNRPELTQKHFLPDPFAETPGVIMYRTGDLVQWRNDGTVQFLGRVDFQVKLRGHRIELDEIQSVLGKHPGVQQNVVKVATGENGEQTLAAFYTPQEGALTNTQLRAYLSQSLPHHMVPSAFVHLPILPLTPNGKVDASALPEPSSMRSDLDGEYAPPRNRIEELLCAIWADILEVDQVGIHDNFFDLGGYSLLGILLFARIESRFGQRLPINLLFQAPIVAQLAVMLALLYEEKMWNVLVPIQTEGSQPPFFCVHGFGGGVIGYADLARLLGPDQPFYGLQAVGIDGRSQIDESIEAMASRYIEAMKTAQPTGPYRIGGYCLGGVVAFEMARQLEAQGEPDSLVAIFEGYAPSRYHERISLFNPRRLATVWRSIPYWFQDYSQLSSNQIRRSIRVKYHQMRMRRRTQRSEKAVTATISADIEHLAPYHRQLMVIHVQALRRYSAGDYGGEVVLFRSQQQSISKTVFGALDDTYGWRQLANGGVEIRTVAGAHRNIHMMPHVTTLAVGLADCLDSFNSR